MVQNHASALVSKNEFCGGNKNEIFLEGFIEKLNEMILLQLNF